LTLKVYYLAANCSKFTLCNLTKIFKNVTYEEIVRKTYENLLMTKLLTYRKPLLRNQEGLRKIVGTFPAFQEV